MLCAVVLLLLLGASLAHAQQPRARKGSWLGVGGGFGSLGLSCSGCASIDRESAGTAYLKIGGTLNDHWRLGGENDTWVKSANGTTVVAGNVSLAAYYYPSLTRGFFLRGGAGFAFYQEKHATNAALGLGLVLGAGYDLKIGGGFALTPVANVNWGSVGDVQRGLETLPGTKQNLVQLALGLTWH
jgi:hypothetical protein